MASYVQTLKTKHKHHSQHEMNIFANTNMNIDVLRRLKRIKKGTLRRIVVICQNKVTIIQIFNQHNLGLNYLLY